MSPSPSSSPGPCWFPEGRELFGQTVARPADDLLTAVICPAPAMCQRVFLGLTFGYLKEVESISTLAKPKPLFSHPSDLVNTTGVEGGELRVESMGWAQESVWT